ncbi:hypothetical protein ACQEVC_45715 [Plantactinospora sp. CA-294935]|uniref:hypothetical protein n=1 Tax=Plantactinospora sp. CA-294935 TaxID=3240012 RepID=UPI003D8D9CB9
MQATPKARRRKVVFKGDDFDALVGPLGLDTQEKQATDLGVDPGNYSRIRSGGGVSAIFMLRFHAKYPHVRVGQYFAEEDR